ncbi:cell wall-binding repeat-containing protein [Miniphocaeibacter halophilus]|uniref:Cell wall-binding repeat-containing protein n=1 Tax=Miniphocaeibacter halophilus TaxID=2931922 RepID=A0AC61MRL9_9FIRM|nr:cell wall-binding repeat-containing protein [Miniphocaeibacter halophilus]QQK08217.1 cell wall-binding repeat-containing protein [Miniphocaeibacter halophilus]
MRKKFTGLLLALTLIINIYPVVSKADNSLNIRRLSGKDRYETAINISRGTFSNSKYIIIASGEDYHDALVGGTLAAQIKAPILLIGKNNVPIEVLDEIKRLSIEQIYLLGGTNTISAKSGDILKETGAKVERLYGANRVETAKKIEEIRYSFAEYIIPGDYYAVVDGRNFADALAAAPFVGQMDPVTYLYPYMENVSSGKSYYMVFGGTSSVPKGYNERIRYAGKNRYDTATKVADAYKSQLKRDIDTIVLVNGEDYPDALASAPVASINNGAILLTGSKKLSSETREYILNNSNIENIIIVGGENSVSSNIENELEAING